MGLGFDPQADKANMMLFRFWPLFLAIVFITPISKLYAQDDFNMRLSWVKTLKSFLLEIENKKADQLLTQDELQFLKKFSLLESAWADSRYDCFYAGWPSKLVSSHGKKLCNSPQRGNAEYDKGSCASSELQCQPLLFGSDLCVSFKGPQDKKMAFAKCEEKFKKEKNNDYSFLMRMSREDTEALTELSHLAADICEKGVVGTQKQTPMCANLLDKLSHGLKAIDRAWEETFKNTNIEMKEAFSSDVSSKAKTQNHQHDQNCDEEHPVLKAVEVKAIQDVLSHNLDELYLKMKKDFENSAFCEPSKIFSDPSRSISPIILGKLSRDLYDVDSIRPYNRETSDSNIEKLTKKYNISSSTMADLQPLFSQMKTEISQEQRLKLSAEAKVLLLQDVARQKDHTPYEDVMKTELVKLNVFQEDDHGKIECPFISKDAFMKGVVGHQEALKSQGRRITNKETLTIVDYTRPSHQRRLFVLDMKEQKVKHNTWVAHGMGGGSVSGIDGKGSSPKISNVKGSLMSSDGFILATRAGYGSRFGNNVLLEGIDKNNKNISERAVLLHGWESPMDEFTKGVRDYDSVNDHYLEPKDVIDELLKDHPRKKSTEELEQSITRIRRSTFVTEFMRATEGCLGVPTTSAAHLDYKKRQKNQLELLREDLPGSLIFSYSGPLMKSSYLD